MAEKPQQIKTFAREVPQLGVSAKSALTGLANAVAALPICALPLAVGSLSMLGTAHAQLPPGAAMGLRALDYRETGHRINVKESVLWVKSPIGELWEVAASGTIDIVSGASANVVANNSGKPVQIYTGASITDRRTAGDISLKRKFGEANAHSLGVSFATSNEEDYDSKAYGVNATFDFNERNTTLAIGYGDRRDTVSSVTDARLNAPRDAKELLLGVTQILDRHSLVQSNIVRTRMSGYLSDPYRTTFTLFTDGLSPRFVLAKDQRPTEKTQWAWMTRYKRNVAELGGVLSAEYRYTSDDWGVRSHTIAGTWLHTFDESWQVEVGLRYYQQSAASFFRKVLVRPTPTITSADQRLAAFGSLEPSVRVVYKFTQQTALDLGYSQYRQQGNWKSGGGSADFEPLEAKQVNVGLVIKF